MTQPDSIMELLTLTEQDYWVMYVHDWKINDGPWRFNTNWDMSTTTTTGVWDYSAEESGDFDICGEPH